MTENKGVIATCTLEVLHKLSTDWVECSCELTKELDALAGFHNSEENLFKHYILVDGLSKIDKQFAIRVPGGTVGYVKVNEENKIRMLYIDTDYVVKSYPSDVNTKIQKYVGQLLKLPE